MKLTSEQRDRLIDDYCWRIVDDMDIKDLCRAMAEQIASDFDSLDDTQVIEQIKEFYPDLTDDLTNQPAPRGDQG